MIFLTLKSLFQTYFCLFISLLLSPVSSTCSLLLLALFGLSHRPPAAVLHRAAKRSPELRCTCSFLLLNSVHQSRRCLSTGGTRPLSALHMKPETIDQQAAGTGAGLGPAFMCLQSGRSPRHQRNTDGCVHVLEAFISVWPGETTNVFLSK